MLRLFKFKIGSITRRWLLNVLLVVVAAVLLTEIIVLFMIRNVYYNGVRAVAEDYIRPFETLAIASKKEFYSKARTIMKNFQYGDRIEVQVIDDNGYMVVSTRGFASSETEMPDYSLALKSPDGSATWEGRSSTGEKIMAGTTLLADFGSGSNGAVRYIFSMRSVNRQILFSYGVTIFIGLIIIVITIWSGVYFIKSIIRPVQQVSDAARKIALGNMDTDLTTTGADEISELCESINYMASELKNADAIKNDFISSVSHELRTPLTAIRGWGETIKMSIGTDDEIVRRGTDVILGEADRLSGLVEELLDFSRMQSGKLSLHMQEINITTILKEAVNIYKETAKQHDIRLTYLQTAPEAMVMADKDRIKQVFINVIDNAIKYSEAGDSVTVGAVKEDGCVLITVKDTGVGISPKDLDHVKEKFYKANKNVRGSGIGLAMADEIVKQHNGLLLLESEEGVGTMVTIVLALLAQPEK